MSLERTALRIAAVMALSNGYAAPYPTIAGGRVYDSRMDPIQGLEAGDLVPVIVVHTDDDMGEEVSRNNGGPTFNRTVSLSVEFQVYMFGYDSADEEDEQRASPTLLHPASEPELEAVLDMFEAQIAAVFADGISTWGGWLDKTHRGIETWQSERFVDRGSGIRLASRQVRVKVNLPPSAEQRLVMQLPGEPAPTVTPALPYPLGSLLAAIVASSSPYAPSAAAMQSLLTAQYGTGGTLVLPSLSGVRLVEGDQGGGRRPQGVADVALPAA